MRYFYLVLLLTVFFSGCAAYQQATAAREEDIEIFELRKAISELDLKIEELNNKFFLLQEKVESGSEKLDRFEKDSIQPPEGLKVVRLKETEGKPSGIAETLPEKLYNRGQDLFIAFKYREARDVFSEFISKFPAHDLSDNALYWIGESYYSEQDYRNAILKFDEAVGRYPQGNKAPDAMLKLGFSWFELGDEEKGIKTLNDLMGRYPQSEASFKAKKKLKIYPTSK